MSRPFDSNRNNGYNAARILGFVALGILLIINAAQVPWTLLLAKEQSATGWGAGTAMGMKLVYPWLAQFFSLPALIFAGVVLGVPAIRTTDKPVVAVTAALAVLSVVQTVLTNLFIFS